MLSIEQRNNAPIEITIKTKASRLIMVLSTEAAATEPIHRYYITSKANNV